MSNDNLFLSNCKRYQVIITNFDTNELLQTSFYVECLICNYKTAKYKVMIGAMREYIMHFITMHKDKINERLASLM